jgi:hypothetical protein
MRIKVKSHDYHVSFKHEPGPPSVLADKIIGVVTNALQARVIAARRLTDARTLRDQRMLAIADVHGTPTSNLDLAMNNETRLCESELRKLDTPEVAVQRVLDKLDRNLRLALKASEAQFIELKGGLGRSARRVYLKRTVATIWVPVMTQRPDGTGPEVRRPKFEDPNATQIISTGSTQCSGLDIYTREEGRAIALARAACKVGGFDRDDIVIVGIQAFPVTATRGRQAYWKECAELRPDLWPSWRAASSPTV